jgi:hypothetical protein
MYEYEICQCGSWAGPIAKSLNDMARKGWRVREMLSRTKCTKDAVSEAYLYQFLMEREVVQTSTGERFTGPNVRDFPNVRSTSFPAET